MNDKAKCILALGALIIFTYIGYKCMPEDEFVIQSNHEEHKQKIYVHIEGCVHEPGIKEVEYGTRIYELIEIAGGETSEADISKINLASLLEDEQKIYIPTKVTKDEQVTNNNFGNVSIYQENPHKMLVNINYATVDELEKLNGIGSTMANRIVEYREKEGYFSSIEDIKNVKGIGKAKFEKIKNDIEI